jgi:hypothetical protein
VRTIFSNNFLLHNRCETFTSSDGFSNSSSYTGVTGGFEGVTISFAMTKSSPASIKTKGAIITIWYLHSQGVNAFI